MVAQIRDELALVAGACRNHPAEPIRGWTVDVWEVSSVALAHLAAAYRLLIVPENIEEQVLAALTEEQVSVSQILYGPASSSTAGITRADMVELAVAASLLAVEGAPIERMVLANVPKGPRNRSEPGLDVLSVVLAELEDPPHLQDFERLFIVSAKHSIAPGLGDLRRKLEDSVSDNQLSVTYLGPQLRLFEHRLWSQGVNAKRVYKFLSQIPFLDPRHVSIVAAGAADASRRSEFASEIQKLKPSKSGLRHLRQVLIPDLAQLQELVG